MEQISRSPKQLGQAIRRQRRTLGWSQKDLGEKTQLRQSTISELEAGKPGAKLSTFFNVLAALDLEIVVRSRSKVTVFFDKTVFGKPPLSENDRQSK